MGLYFQGQKSKIYFNGSLSNLHINVIASGGEETPIGEYLMSSDGQILMSLDDYYFTPKGSEE